MTSQEKRARRERLAAKRLRQKREPITESHTLTPGQKCHSAGWMEGWGWYGLGEKYLKHFAHRQSPVPGIRGRWHNPQYRRFPVGAAVRRLLGEPEELEPPARTSRRDVELLGDLTPYADEGAAHRRPERSWKSHRKTQWKTPKNSKP